MKIFLLLVFIVSYFKKQMEVIVIEKKHRKKFGTSVDKNLIDSLKLLSQKTKIPMSRLVDEAINDILKKYKERRVG